MGSGDYRDAPATKKWILPKVLNYSGRIKGEDVRTNLAPKKEGLLQANCGTILRIYGKVDGEVVPMITSISHTIHYQSIEKEITKI